MLITWQNKENIKRAIAMHAAARRTRMLQQLCEGLQLYRLVDIMEQNKEVCRGLFVFEGGNDQGDSQYIVSHLDHKMSESTLKHSEEMQILNNFQDFLMELEDGDPEDEEALCVSKVMQWLSGQAHVHLLLSERQYFKTTVQFDHTCMERMPDHRICYPVVSAWTQTITFPTAHSTSLNEFKENMKIAVQQGAYFYRV
ncbi:si:dkey-14o1.20 [Danio rerio]|uniref:Si:dkey-14o1.20 n=1 Tax=Danio rerio TaxID=7955 RepID=A0AB13AAW1_DANRE|nr:si:dkey-14o1.20 [Danio rerio]